MKKITVFVAVFCLFLCLLCGCSDTGKTVSGNGSKNNITILAADFAEYDWIKAVLGDNPSNISLDRLNETGADMHSYQPRVSDMVRISDCSLLVYSGGESEFWIKDAVISSGKAQAEVISLMDILAHDPGLSQKYADLADEHEHEHGHEHEDEAHHDSENEPEFDEHMWLSLKSAPVFIEKITEAISSLDPENSVLYEKNARNYINKINELDLKYEEMSSKARSCNHNTVLIADRFPFAYLMKDYGISHIAAFPGCSAETEASFAVIVSLSESIDRLGLKNVFVMKKSDTALAETIIKNSSSKDAKILTLDSMQSVSSGDISKGENYLSVMEKNLAALSAALTE